MNTEQWQDYKVRQKRDLEAHKRGTYLWYGYAPSSERGLFHQCQGTVMRINGEYEPMPESFRPSIHGTRRLRRMSPYKRISHTAQLTR